MCSSNTISKQPTQHPTWAQRLAGSLAIPAACLLLFTTCAPPVVLNTGSSSLSPFQIPTTSSLMEYVPGAFEPGELDPSDAIVVPVHCSVQSITQTSTHIWMPSTWSCSPESSSSDTIFMLGPEASPDPNP